MSDVANKVPSSWLDRLKARKFFLSLAGGAILFSIIQFRSSKRNPETRPQASNSDKKKKKDRNRKWLIRILLLIFAKKRVIVTFVSLAALLILKVIISMKIADMLGEGASLVVSCKFTEAMRHMLKFALLSIPAAAINSSIKTFQDLLAAQARAILNSYIHDRYLEGTRFYDIAYWGITSQGDSRIKDAHQRIVIDLNNLCTEMSAVFVGGFKPLLDIIFYSHRVRNAMGLRGLSLIWGYFILMFVVKSALSPAFGRLSKRASNLEGQYSSAQQRVTNSAEEIAFFRGAGKEKLILNAKLQEITYHAISTTWKGFYMGFIDHLLGKYFATVVAYITMCLPILFPVAWGIEDAEGRTTVSLTRDYSRNSQYLFNLAGGVKSIALLTTRMNKISGLLSRVAELLQLLRTLERRPKTAPEVKKLLKDSQEKQLSSSPSRSISDTRFLQKWKEHCFQLRPQTGKESIIFEGVTVVSPDLRLLVKDLNLVVNSGENVLITGPNGSGKSSIFRGIGGLWPIAEGSIGRSPENVEIFFLTQNPYFVLGNLRDQIIYPLTKKEAMKRCGLLQDDSKETGSTRVSKSRKDEEREFDGWLRALLDVVDPKCDITRDLDVKKDWTKELSGGQRQLLSMVRLAFHRPTFALLDECTSAISPEKDGIVFEMCMELGITMLSISHKHRFHRQYHHRELRLLGNGDYRVKDIPAEKKLMPGYSPS